MHSNNEERKMYDTIKMPHELILRIERLVSSSEMGYRNRSEFIIEAVREKIQQIAKMEVHA